MVEDEELLFRISWNGSKRIINWIWIPGDDIPAVRGSSQELNGEENGLNK